MIILIDNYDSFSYNLCQLFGSIEPDIRVVRNDTVTPEDIAALKPEAVIISPGPGKPADAGICIEAVKKLGRTIPMLGVCLGHQSICMAYGARVSYAKKLMHGKQSMTKLDVESPLFSGCPQTVFAARYHSLAVIEDTIPECLRVTARTDDGEVMAVQHREYPVFGVQFHPESVMTPDGGTMAANFLRFSKSYAVNKK